MSKKIKTRIQQKHEKPTDWAAAADFAPLHGELIVYDAEDDTSAPRLKVGNALGSALSKLPFVEAVPTGIYGVCSTAAATAAKEVEIDGFTLKTGAMIIVKFTYSNSASQPTLNVNGTGAKPLRQHDTAIFGPMAATSGWYAGAVILLIYDGTNWVRNFWYNSTYTNETLGNGYGTCTTAAGTVAKTATLTGYSLARGLVAIKFNNDVPKGATLNIASKGAKEMYYQGAEIAANTIKAGDTATFWYDGSYYHVLSIDRWQKDIDAVNIAVSNVQASVNSIKSLPAVTAADKGKTLRVNASGEWVALPKGRVLYLHGAYDTGSENGCTFVKVNEPPENEDDYDVVYSFNSNTSTFDNLLALCDVHTAYIWGEGFYVGKNHSDIDWTHPGYNYEEATAVQLTHSTAITLLATDD
jgi:hypothetical protein